jgi:predicted metalloenzyme YecM
MPVKMRKDVSLPYGKPKQYPAGISALIEILPFQPQIYVERE